MSTKIVDMHKILLYIIYAQLERSVCMAVKIRLTRMGAKKAPFYRLVVADSRSPRDGRFVEQIGTYNPLTTPAEIKINEELALKWLNNGAIPTDTVKNLLSDAGIMKKFHESKMGK